jgi:hypothetical protein
MNRTTVDLPLAISQYLDNLEPEILLEQPPVIPLPTSVPNLRDCFEDYEVRSSPRQVVLRY